MHFSDYFLWDIQIDLFRDFLIELEHEMDVQTNLIEHLFHLKIHVELNLLEFD
jgi:hypothetical protein